VPQPQTGTLHHSRQSATGNPCLSLEQKARTGGCRGARAGGMCLALKCAMGDTKPSPCTTCHRRMQKAYT
jgi:hypothetical protein